MSWGVGVGFKELAGANWNRTAAGISTRSGAMGRGFRNSKGRQRQRCHSFRSLKHPSFEDRPTTLKEPVHGPCTASFAVSLHTPTNHAPADRTPCVLNNGLLRRGHTCTLTTMIPATTLTEGTRTSIYGYESSIFQLTEGFE